jgi:hypothetical protein
MKRFLVLFALAFPAFSFAQTAQIKNIQLAGNKVIVHYDLDDESPTNEYQLGLYASTDNFSVPMSKVKGDVGGEIKPGTNKKIEWDIKDELGDFTGDISLEIRGKVFVVFVKLKDFDSEKTYKRGKRYGISWKPGNTNPIHIELYKGAERMTGELNHPNSGAYTLSLPSKIEPGKDYRLKISDSKKPDDVVYTEYFVVKQRVPLIAKIAAAAIVVGGLTYLGLNLSGEAGKEDPNIEDPIGLPDNN